MDGFQTLWPIWRIVFHSKTIVVDPPQTPYYGLLGELGFRLENHRFYFTFSIICNLADYWQIRESSSPHPSPHKLRSIVKLEEKSALNHSFSGFAQATNDSPKMRGERKKVEKNVSVEKIGLGGSYATHCKNDLFNAVFGGCTLPACMCLFKGSTPNTIWKQEIRMIGSERKSESYSCLNASITFFENNKKGLILYLFCGFLKISPIFCPNVNF